MDSIFNDYTCLSKKRKNPLGPFLKLNLNFKTRVFQGAQNNVKSIYNFSPINQKEHLKSHDRRR